MSTKIIRIVIGIGMSAASALLISRLITRRDWQGAILALVLSIYIALAHRNDPTWNAP